MHARVCFGSLLTLLFAFTAACGIVPDSSAPDGLTFDQEQALLSNIAMAALAVGQTDDVASGKAVAGTAPAALESCTPQKLTPPTNCAAGGRIFHTINLECSVDDFGCCTADPPSCTEIEARVVGQGSTIFSNCAMASDDGSVMIVTNNTLFSQLDVLVTVGCSGWAVGGANMHINGNLSVTVNGREACNGITSLNVEVGTSPSVFVSVSGTLCGRSVSFFFNGGCGGPQCGDGCCAQGTICQNTCGTTSCAPAAFPVDCCNNRFCPEGTTCSSDGNSCQFKQAAQATMSLQSWPAPPLLPSGL